MSKYDDTNSGALFANDKDGVDKRPDRRGPLKVKCPHCGETTDGELAGWLREAKNDGKRFLSVKWQPKDDKPQANGDRAQQGPQEQPGGGDLDDEIPFSPVKLLP